MSDKDTPTITDTWAGIEKMVADRDPGPYVLALPDSTRITFPNPGDMQWDEAENFIREVMTASNTAAFKKWLSRDDYAKFADLKPTLAQVTALSQNIGKHYEDAFGPVGESIASRA